MNGATTVAPRRAAPPASIAALACALACTLAAAPARALKVATWNMLHYQETATNFSTRQPNFRTVMAALDVDVLVCQEMNSQAGADSFLTNVLGVVSPGQWSGQWKDVSGGSGGEGMGVFWKPAKVTPFAISAVNTGGVRWIMQLGVRIVGYGTGTLFKVFSVHLKAGNPAFTPSDSTTRRLECTSLRNYLNGPSAGGAFLLVGDSNFYGDWEGGYARLLESQLDNDGRCKDPLALSGTWNNPFFAPYHTQSPCLSGCISADFSGGGMDDRFDLILTSYPMQDGAGLDVVPGTTVPYGNDGQHYNDNINGGGFNLAVGLTVATALRSASDHIPVVVTIQVPAKVSAVSQLDVGRVYVGSAPTQSLSVADGATPPADELNYTLTAPAGFTAPAGTFNANAGQPGNAHSIGMDASTVGDRSGLLTVASNDPDSASKQVNLSGIVVRHAVASLDSSAVTTAATIDFGTHSPGQFQDAAVRVHNHGLNPDGLQALLSIDSATITGGGGRFSVAGGFTPTTVGGTGRTFNLHFNDAGATLDSTYDATLTFGTSEEPLPGQAATASLVLQLHARPASGAVGVGSEPVGPPLRVEPARPNPLSRGTTFAFQLPAAQSVSLDVYDLGGRRIASLVSGEQAAGRHEVAWSASDARGTRVAGGLYFARFAAAGLTRIQRVVVLP